ncbi:MAG: hypothetical protein IIC54_02245 [Proteobacteria bacterium]|nr:hypothetical protein [Pseudomonadota bacterium]
MTNNSEDIEFRRLALEHAWHWFELHANQRLLLFRFYLVMVGISFAGYVGSVKETIFFGEMAFPILGIAISYLFNALDKRTSQLIKIAETCLAPQQEFIATKFGDDNFKLVEKAETKPPGVLSYRRVFSAIQIITYLIFVSAFLYSLSSFLFS